MNILLQQCRVIYGSKRNNKIKKFFVLDNECIATTCSTCRQIVLSKDMVKNKRKPYGLDSRCKECNKEIKRGKYQKIDFDSMIKSYKELNNIDYDPERGMTKNGYSRIKFKNPNTGLYEHLSCCDCKTIKPINMFDTFGSSDNTGKRGNCIECQIKDGRFIKEK